MTITLVGAVAVLAAVAASAGGFSQPSRVLVATTGNDSELTDHLDITNAQGAGAVAVMSLPLSSMKAGERLRVSSELQVTTDCIDSAGHCGHYADGALGHPYDYNPLVDAQLILASAPNATTGMPITSPLKRRCRQRLPYRHHHCVLALRATTVDVPSGTDAQYVNLVASAWNRRGDAQRGDRLIVGEDEPDGSILEDKGRINVARLRPDSSATGRVQRLSTSAPVTGSLPIGGDSIRHTVVFSKRIDNLKQDEQLEVAARIDTDIGQNQDRSAPNYLPYNVLIKSRLIITSSPVSTMISRRAKRATILDGEVTEANGFNCTHHKNRPAVWWDSPCRVVKFGVSSLRKDVKELYVNLVIGTKAKRDNPGAGDAVNVAPCSPRRCGLQVLRYPASRAG